MSLDNFSAVILAAGFSSRMGCFKPLLSLGSKTVIQRVISIFKENGVKDIFVVTGHRSDEVALLAKFAGAQVVDNQDFQTGMFSSVKAGVKEIRPGTAAFFVMPSDIPLVRRFTISRLMSEFEKNPGKIIHPRFSGKRGHPPLIPISLFPDIINGSGHGGLKAILDAHKSLEVCVDVPDQNILFDIDYPHDYQELLNRWQSYEIPSPEECDMILEKIHPVSDSLFRHCRRVAQAAMSIGQAIDLDINLNIKLIRAGAMLHDIAKGKKDHAQAGAVMLKEMGFHQVGEIVALHTDLSVTENSEISEAEVVYLADKFVKGEQIIPLSKRFDLAAERFKDNPDAIANIRIRRQQAMTVKKRLEVYTKQPLETIIENHTKIDLQK
ncbi:NTP transferase domain-containing protein, HD domain-containing [Desulfonema limicola]|uniref:NTP transferase domain-containing protein, HD domain-containing n=1 Tax=Desulfonema limicola TaxID=45656 RepID=A0A975GG70_9BACT|nr:NTP transferase domain-containing protein [Desulfonema limicola]QTA79949.1 NTP transferase domain-containing protein, HD domain-containing [Desulfonema limicola]